MNLGQLKQATQNMAATYQLWSRFDQQTLPLLMMNGYSDQIVLTPHANGCLTLADLRSLPDNNERNLLIQWENQKQLVFGYHVQGRQLYLG